MDKIDIETKSLKETQKTANFLAKEIIKDPGKKHALVLALSGELGGGKTTFVQGFAKGLGIKEKVKSPTFLILKNYKLQTKNYKLFTHIDAYRLKSAKEIIGLGWNDLVRNPHNIVAVEWARNIKKVLPKGSLKIDFKFISLNKRLITFNV